MSRKKTSNQLSESGKKISPEKELWGTVKYYFKPKNSYQVNYMDIIRTNQITLTKGPAGVGKSLVALATALELLKDRDTPYKKLVLMVAPVQTDIEIGYIKGGISDKLDPFAYSYLYNMADMIQGGIQKVNELREAGLIEIICVSFARGINLKDCVCICGECQQYSKESFLTIITRPCETAKVIFEGDLNQIDNKNIRRGKEASGLRHALDCLKDLPGIGVMDFTGAEIVRNPLISKILNRWDPDKYSEDPE